MKKNTSIINDSGFSILEMTVVLIIMGILLSSVIPVLSRGYLEKAANKTALDISTIQEASRKYYIDHNQWPGSVDTTPLAVLQDPANGYLPAMTQWNAINPFGASAATPLNYIYTIQMPTSSSLTVCTLVPSRPGYNAQAMIINSLPSAYVDTSGDSTNGDVCSTISVPGQDGNGFGTPIPLTTGQVYSCPTGGWIMANIDCTNYNNAQGGIHLYTDSSNPPETLLSSAYCAQCSGCSGTSYFLKAESASAICTAGNYYEVIYDNIFHSPTVTAEFVPNA